MPQLFSNNASSVLAAALTSSASSLTLASGSGAKFPNPGGGNYFVLTLYQMSGNIEINHEIVRCTARAGDVLTIVRGQEGTTARAFNLADPVSMRLTAGALTPAALGAMDATASLGGVVLLANITPGIANKVNFLTLFSNAFDYYRVTGTGIVAESGGRMSLRLAVGGVPDAANNYVPVSEGVSTQGSQAGSYAVIMDIGVGTLGGNFVIDILNANNPVSAKSILASGSANINGTTTYIKADRGTIYPVANAVSGFQLFFDNGTNFAVGGNVRVFGFKNT